jgi:hypothetical protein
MCQCTPEIKTPFCGAPGCAWPGSAPKKPASWSAELTREKFHRLIEPLREVARQNGYALAVHGSLARDIDLIAVPWADVCAEPVALAEQIMLKAREVNEGIAFMAPHEDSMWRQAGSPGAKPHGRLVWSFHLGGGPYIDLSVMPKRPA